jgi:hypothetical protein
MLYPTDPSRREPAGSSRRAPGFALSRTAILALAWLAASAAVAQTGAHEQRIALVIGNATYKVAPLDNTVNDARAVAEALRIAQFKVTLRENLDRQGLFDALRAFGGQLTEDSVAVLYYAGHGLQLRDRNYLIPVDAEIQNEDEIPISGVDVGFILGRMSFARSRVNIVILDACRNNPFAGLIRPLAQGLAQMDAPVGTLIAYATAPGKLASDGEGNRGVYAENLVNQLLTPGLPVEIMFRRVREGVVRETRQEQIPWESSSLQGDFEFVPTMILAGPTAGSTAIAAVRPPLAAGPPVAAGPPPVPAGAPPVPAGTPPVPAAPPSTLTVNVGPPDATRLDLLPRAGDSWQYRVLDRFRLGDLYVTAKLEAVGPRGLVEEWSSSSGDQVRSAPIAGVGPRFQTLAGWDLTPPEFSPYLLASGPLRAGQRLGLVERRIDNAVVPMEASVAGEEDLSVPAGQFRTVKVVLKAVPPPAPVRGAVLAGSFAAEQTVWYAPAVKRVIKSTLTMRVDNEVKESTTFELMSYKVQ